MTVKTRKKMYVVESSLSTQEPIMLLNQPIGFDSNDPGAGYIDGTAFQRELLELDNAGYKCIKLFINSPGGNVIDGYNICNAILKTKTPIDTYNVGIAASMAGIIFMTGRKRVMADYASLMIHNPFGGDDKKMLGAMRASTITILAAKCHVKEEDISYMMDRETWLRPSECLEKGFCTEIEVTSESNQKRMPAVSAKAIWQEANLIQANLFNSVNMADINTSTQAKAIGLSLVAAYLDLNVDSTEQAVLTAVKTRVNTEILARTKAEESLASLEASMTKAKKELSDMTEKYNAKVKEQEDAEAKAKKEKEEADAKVAKAALDSKKVEARAMVEVFAKAEGGKRIKTEAVDKWVDMAVETDVSKVKGMLEELPLNVKAAASAHVVAKKKDGEEKEANDPMEVGMSAMSLQARIQARVNAKRKED